MTALARKVGTLGGVRVGDWHLYAGGLCLNVEIVEKSWIIHESQCVYLDLDSFLLFGLWQYLWCLPVI